MSFAVYHISEIRLFRKLLAEMAFSAFVLGDFLEQFILITSRLAMSTTPFVFVFILIGTFLFAALMESLYEVYYGVLSGYSSLEMLFLRKLTLFFLSAFFIIFLFNLIGMFPFAFTFTGALSVPLFFGGMTFLL